MSTGVYILLGKSEYRGIYTTRLRVSTGVYILLG